ncbi:hypothetical protein K439DRAFT_52090 [Ramaria rubella]|nr:hypothetical protein K439DRAFT_52090 [Ramaria rubella]
MVRAGKGLQVTSKLADVSPITEYIIRDLPVDEFHKVMIERDPKTWVDIVERCGGFYGRDADRQHHGLIAVLSDKVTVRGTAEFVRSLDLEVAQTIEVEHTRITAKRVSLRHHQPMSCPTFIKDLRQHTGAMVYFPSSGGYREVGMPGNIDDYERVPAEDIVKIVGSAAACEKARDYLENQIEQKREEERNSYRFPAHLHHVVKIKTEPRFKALGISISETEAPVVTQPLRSFASDEVIEAGKNWKICHPKKNNNNEFPMCGWRLEATSAQALQKGRELLLNTVQSCTRIGILELPAALDVTCEKGILSIPQHDRVYFEISPNVEAGSSSKCLVLTGPKTNMVKAMIDRVLLCVDTSGGVDQGIS